jgi:adenine-specific DNA methylase
MYYEVYLENLKKSYYQQHLKTKKHLHNLEELERYKARILKLRLQEKIKANLLKNQLKCEAKEDRILELEKVKRIRNTKNKAFIVTNYKKGYKVELTNNFLKGMGKFFVINMDGKEKDYREMLEDTRLVLSNVM